MSRLWLLAKLPQYMKKFPTETDTVTRVIEFIQAHPNCFDRYQAPGHLTGSAWLVNSTGEQVLLTRHRKLGIWLQPGGHAEPQDAKNIHNVSRRETIEESGIPNLNFWSRDIFDIDIHTIPEQKSSEVQQPAHLHYDIRFILQATPNAKPVISAESLNLAWVAITAIRTYTDEISILRMANKWINLCEQP